MATNMDIIKHPNATSDIYEFKLPVHEVGQDVNIGEYGVIMIPCCVTGKDTQTITFRKDGVARPETKFEPEDAEHMEVRLDKKEEKK